MLSSLLPWKCQDDKLRNRACTVAYRCTGFYRNGWWHGHRRRRLLYSIEGCLAVGILWHWNDTCFYASHILLQTCTCSICIDCEYQQQVVRRMHAHMTKHDVQGNEYLQKCESLPDCSQVLLGKLCSCFLQPEASKPNLAYALSHVLVAGKLG